MKKGILVLFALFCSQLAQAAPEYSLTAFGAFDFSAPVIYDRAVFTSATAGQIVFDSKTGSFYGLPPGTNPTPAVNWLQLSPVVGSASVVNTSTGVEVVNRATIAGSGSPTATQNGSWISSITRNGAGDYTLTINGYSAAPSCVCTQHAGGTEVICTVSGITSTSVRTHIVEAGSHNPLDNDYSIICMGPQ